MTTSPRRGTRSTRRRSSSTRPRQRRRRRRRVAYRCWSGPDGAKGTPSSRRTSSPPAATCAIPSLLLPDTSDDRVVDATQAGRCVGRTSASPGKHRWLRDGRRDRIDDQAQVRRRTPAAHPMFSGRRSRISLRRQGGRKSGLSSRRVRAGRDRARSPTCWRPRLARCAAGGRSCPVRSRVVGPGRSASCLDSARPRPW